MTETRFIGLGIINSHVIELQYMQYYNGNPVARFKIQELLKTKQKCL